MSAIEKLSDKMKKKLSFGDYALPPESQGSASVRKSYALSKNDSHKLQEIFSKRLKTGPTSVADIMSEAIQLLYKNDVIAS